MPKLASLPCVQSVLAPESALAVQLGVVVFQFPEMLVPGVAPSGSQTRLSAKSGRGTNAKKRTARDRIFMIETNLELSCYRTSRVSQTFCRSPLCRPGIGSIRSEL